MEDKRTCHGHSHVDDDEYLSKNKNVCKNSYKKNSAIKILIIALSYLPIFEVDLRNALTTRDFVRDKKGTRNCEFCV